MSTPSRKVVLVVDDEPTILQVLSRGLGAAGFVVHTASNLRDAEVAFMHVPLDAMIVDLRLGREESGLTLVARARGTATLARLPIMLLTGVTDMTGAEEDGIRHHRPYVFYKPVQLEAIVAKLDQLLGVQSTAPRGSSNGTARARAFG